MKSHNKCSVTVFCLFFSLKMFLLCFYSEAHHFQGVKYFTTVKTEGEITGKPNHRQAINTKAKHWKTG